MCVNVGYSELTKYVTLFKTIDMKIEFKRSVNKKMIKHAVYWEQKCIQSYAVSVVV